MPVSRRRIKRNRSELERRRRASRYHQAQRLAATMTDGQMSTLVEGVDWATLRASADAELRGDAGRALELYRSIDQFDDSPHKHRLELLAELGDEAPGWLVSRWLTLQARRPLWSGAPTDQEPPPAARLIDIAYPHGVAPDRLRGRSMPVFVSTLYEYDWVLRQLIVYEDGGLAELVQHVAGPELLGRADFPDAWAAAPMGGYRFESAEAARPFVTDLATDESIELLDLGIGFEHRPGQHLIGRVVPTRSQPGRMFEWRPLPVDEGTAVDVARCPERWTDVVADHARSQQLPPGFSLMDDGTDVLTDLCDHTWLAALEPGDIRTLPTVDGIVAHADVALFVLERLLRFFGRLQRVPTELQPVVFSLVLQPGLSDDVEARLCRPEHAAGWSAIAGAVLQPAAARANDCARRCRQVG